MNGFSGSTGKVIQLHEAREMNLTSVCVIVLTRVCNDERLAAVREYEKGTEIADVKRNAELGFSSD